jgi:hypothetical protein
MKMFIYPQLHLFQKLLQIVLTLFKNLYLSHEFYQTRMRFTNNSKVTRPSFVHKNLISISYLIINGIFN